ncbi:MAG TPA: NUDIX domain-containing protein [Candidatus Saccharimonadales bacterium]|nr:NUDIX domain-containing protein [Candidatus Saccharimonadales bacterium]
MVKFEDRYRFIGSVYVLLRDSSKVLLLRRANTGYHDGEYSLPAGHMDGGEPAALAAVREAKEEVGVNIDPKDLDIVHTLHRYSDQPEPHERIDLFFETDTWKGEPTNAEPDKCDELKWVAIGNLPENMVPEVEHMFREMARRSMYSDFNFIARQ